MLTRTSEEFQFASRMRYLKYQAFNEELESKKLQLRKVRETIQLVITLEDSEDEIEELKVKENSLEKQLDEILQKRQEYFKVAE